tara:strand:+ start:172 stop:735 length:564 start_codon:yes stop_codon:yes gene_type:complete
MDVLGGLSSNSDSSFLTFKTADQAWYIGSEVLDFTYMQLDPETFQSGWGMYNSGEWLFKWDEKFGVPDDKPSDDYKRAFNAWVLVDGYDKPLNWVRFDYAQRTAFNQILGLFWNDLHGKAPALPTVKFEKSERITVGKGNSSELTFSWVDFKPRKAEFVIPEWANDDAPVKALVEAESKITNDDIPF